MFWPLRNPPPPEPVEDTSLQMDPNAVEALKKINSKTFDVEKYIYQPHGKFAFAAQKELITDGLTFDTGQVIGEGFSMCIKKGSIADHPVTVFHKLWNASKYWDQFFTELYLFSHPQLLRFLQGDCVPHIINVSHHREGNKAIAMELPHYGVWRTATPGMPVDLKRGVLDAYARIHAQGVLHGDISLHNIFLGFDDKVTIIGFGKASCLEGLDVTGVSLCSPSAFEYEMRAVKYIIDYDGSKEKERALINSSIATSSCTGTHVDPDNQLLPLSTDDMQKWDQEAEDESSRTIVVLPPEWICRPLPNDGRALRRRGAHARADSRATQSRSTASTESNSPSNNISGQGGTNSLSRDPTAPIARPPVSSPVLESHASPANSTFDEHLALTAGSLPSQSSSAARQQSPLSVCIPSGSKRSRPRPLPTEPLAEPGLVPMFAPTDMISEDLTALAARAAIPSTFLASALTVAQTERISEEPVEAAPHSAIPYTFLSPAPTQAASPSPNIASGSSSPRSSSDRPISESSHLQLGKIIEDGVSPRDLRLAVKRRREVFESELAESFKPKQPKLDRESKRRVYFRPDVNDNGTWATGYRLVAIYDRPPTPFPGGEWLDLEDPDASDPDSDSALAVATEDSPEDGEQLTHQTIHSPIPITAGPSRLVFTPESTSVSNVVTTSSSPSWPVLPTHTVVFIGHNGEREAWRLSPSTFTATRNLVSYQDGAERLQYEDFVETRTSELEPGLIDPTMAAPGGGDEVLPTRRLRRRKVPLPKAS